MNQFGVYTSDNTEIVLTQNFVYKLGKYDDVIFTQLFYKADLLVLYAVCEHNLIKHTTSYAFKNLQGDVIGNNDEKIKAVTLSKPFDDNLDNFELIEPIQITTDFDLPIANGNNTKECLKSWRKGGSLTLFDNALQFTLVTNKVEYVCHIHKENDNIYCGASINIPASKGMAGGNQYFRLRNFGDNSQPWCRFYCDFKTKLFDREIDENLFIEGQCNMTNKGIFWSVKRFSDSQIILQGCGEDEYIYSRDNEMTERYI